MRWKKWKGGTQRMAKYKALVEEFKEKEAHRAAQKELKEQLVMDLYEREYPIPSIFASML